MHKYKLINCRIPTPTVSCPSF